MSKEEKQQLSHLRHIVWYLNHLKIYRLKRLKKTLSFDSDMEPGKKGEAKKKKEIKKIIVEKTEKSQMISKKGKARKKSDVKRLKPKKDNNSSDDDDAECLYCSHLFSESSRWVQCPNCRIWAHCACARLEHEDENTIGPITESTCQLDGKLAQENNNIAIHVTPPDGEEDEFVPPLRLRRKLSTPLSGIPGSIDGLNTTELLRLSPRRCLSPLDRTKRRFSTMVSSAAAAAVSRRLSATIEWCLATPTQVKPQIVRQGRALCLQYIKTQIRRSSSCVNKQIVLKRLQRMLETECGEEATNNIETGVLAALRALCAALERKRPEAFRHVARQAARTPSTILRSDTALAELTLALARRITRENITWSKIAAVYCICGALAREAAEASDEPSLELLSSPAAAIADLLHEEPGSWIASHGGWNGLIERLRISERDQRSEKMLRVLVSFFAMACCFLLLLRWVIHAHPAYYE